MTGGVYCVPSLDALVHSLTPSSCAIGHRAAGRLEGARVQRLRFPFFYPPHHFYTLENSTPQLCLIGRITTPKIQNVPLDANVSMNRIVADGDGVVVTGRGGRLIGLIANNEGVILILMLVIVILSTLFLGGKYCIKHYFGCRHK